MHAVQSRKLAREPPNPLNSSNPPTAHMRAIAKLTKRSKANTAVLRWRGRRADRAADRLRRRREPAGKIICRRRRRSRRHRDDSAGQLCRDVAPRRVSILPAAAAVWAASVGFVVLIIFFFFSVGSGGRWNSPGCTDAGEFRGCRGIITRVVTVFLFFSHSLLVI